MSEVFKEVYEVVGNELLKQAQTHAELQTVAWNAQWVVVKALGAEGFRPGHGGYIKSLMFKKNSKGRVGLRKIGTDNGRSEWVPRQNTKAGLEIQKQLNAAGCVEDWGKFANKFGKWKDMPCHNGKTYFATGVHVHKPRERFFLTFPRTLKDSWTPPAGLELVRESDMLRAIEDHNIAVKEKANA